MRNTNNSTTTSRLARNDEEDDLFEKTRGSHIELKKTRVVEGKVLLNVEHRVLGPQRCGQC